MSVPQNKFHLEHSCRMNVFYHEERERHFTRTTRWTAYLTILLSSTAVAALGNLPLPAELQDQGLVFATLSALLVAIVNGAALVFDWYGQLTLHARFKAKWMTMLVEAGLMKDDDSAHFAELVRQYAALSSDESPPNEKQLKVAEAKADAAYGVKSGGS